MFGKDLRKIIKQLCLMFYILKIKEFILPTFQNTERQKWVILLMTSDDDK